MKESGAPPKRGGRVPSRRSSFAGSGRGSATGAAAAATRRRPKAGTSSSCAAASAARTPPPLDASGARRRRRPADADSSRSGCRHPVLFGVICCRCDTTRISDFIHSYLLGHNIVITFLIIYCTAQQTQSELELRAKTIISNIKINWVERLNDMAGPEKMVNNDPQYEVSSIKVPIEFFFYGGSVEFEPTRKSMSSKPLAVKRLRYCVRPSKSSQSETVFGRPTTGTSTLSSSQLDGVVCAPFIRSEASKVFLIFCFKITSDVYDRNVRFERTWRKSQKWTKKWFYDRKEK